LFPEKQNKQVEKLLFSGSVGTKRKFKVLPGMLILWIILSSIIFLAFCDYRLY